MKRRFLSTLMALVLALSLVPTAALAIEGDVAQVGDQTYPTLQAAVDAATEGSVITLLADIDNSIVSDGYTSSIKCSLPANATLDGDGHTLKGDISIYVNTAGGTIMDVNFVDIHNNAIPSTTENNRYGFVDKVGKLTAIYGSNLTGKMVVTGCTFDGFDWEGIQITPQAGATVEITDNTFTSKDMQSVRNVHVESSYNVDFSVTVTRNKFYNAGVLKETALEIYYPSDVNKVNLAGNYIQDPVGVCILTNSGTNRADLAIPFANKDFTQEVYPAVRYNSANTYFYLTIAQALDAGRTTLTLAKDVTEDVVLSEAKDITLSCGDYTFTGSIANAENNLTVNGGEAILNNVTCQTLSVQNAGKVTIKDGTVNNISVAEGATLSITGGTFSTYPGAYVPTGYVVTPDAAAVGPYTVTESDTGAMKVDADVTSGNVSASLDGVYKGTNTEIDNADNDANGSGETSATSGVTVDLTTSDSTGASTATLTVTEAAATSMADNNAPSLTVQTNVGTVELDQTALNKVAEATEEVSITVTKNTTSQGVVASYTVEVKAGDANLLPDGDDNGTITLTLPVPEANRSTTLYVWYAVEQNGSVMYVNQVGTYTADSGNAVTFDVGHLSRYDLLTTDQPNGTAVASITKNGATTYYTSLTGDDGAIAQAATGDTIVLLQNIEATAAEGTPSYEGAIVINKSITLDGNGKIISVGESFPNTSIIHIENSGKVTIKNLTINGTNYTAEGQTGSRHCINIHTSSGSATKSNVTLENVVTTGGLTGVTCGGSDLTIRGDETNIATGAWNAVNIDNTSSSADEPSLTVEAGTIGRISLENSAPTEGDRVSAEIKGGNIAGIVKAEDVEVTDVTVTGGNFATSIADVATTPDYEVDKNSGSYPYSYTDDFAAAVTAAGPSGEVTAVNVAETATKYTVTMDYRDGSASRTVEVADNTSITLPEPTRYGYTFAGWYVNGSRVTSPYTVTGAVTLRAEWTANSTDSGSTGSSGGSGSSDPSYSPVMDITGNGDVRVNPRTPSEGDEVTITVDPDRGYEVDEVIVRDRNGNRVDVTAERNGTYTFEQPRGRVTIEVTFVPTGTATFFNDVPETFWAYNEIAWAYENGYVNGTTATTFSPNASISRQQVWMILARLSGADPANMAAAQAWAVENGISDGTTPGNAVTRQQLVALLYRYATLMGYANDARADLSIYPDAGTVASYAVEPMQWSVANNIVAGTSDGTLNPTGTATRAQFAVILYRFWEQIG